MKDMKDTDRVRHCTNETEGAKSCILWNKTSNQPFTEDRDRIAAINMTYCCYLLLKKGKRPVHLCRPKNKKGSIEDTIDKLVDKMYTES